MASNFLNSTEELKNLVIWLKSQKVKRVKIGDIEIELSDISLLEEASQHQDSRDEMTGTDFDQMSKEELDELIDWNRT